MARAAALAALLFVAALQIHRVDDGDTWWHLASGRLIAETGAIADADPFSYTAPGAPWINRQWLFDLTTYGAWRLAGPTGLILLGGTGFFVGFLALFLLARRYLPPWAAAVLLGCATSCAVERFTIRPEAATFCFLGLTLLTLDRRALSPRHLIGLVLLQIVWANCHALSVLGIVALGSELAGSAAGLWLPLPAGWRAASRRDPLTVASLAIATGAAVLAEAATPFGVTGALFPLRLLGVLRGEDVTSLTIVEHRPPVLAEISPAAAFGLIALLVLAALGAIVSARRWRLSHVCFAAVCVGLALLARRNVALVGLGTLPLIAAGLAPAIAFVEGWSRSRAWSRIATAGAVAVIFALATAGIVTGRYYDRAHLTRTFGLGVAALGFPAAAVDFLDAEAPDDRIFNDDGLGGYLLWRGFPRRRVFIDGRLQVYPASVYSEYQRVLDDPRQFAPLVARYGIRVVILYHPAPGRLEMARAIASSPGWRIAYVDGGAVVLRKVDGEQATPVRIGPADQQRPSILDRLAAPFRPPIEASIAHYQRGRALLYLLGRESAGTAKTDFQTALHLWPSLEEAAVGLKAANDIIAK